MQQYTEISEADAVTTYNVGSWIVDTTSATGTRVLIADSQVYGRMLFLDGELQSASADEHIYHEALVHPAMTYAYMERGTPLRVLVVGGGEGATVREVLRHQVASVDWVDYDVELVNLCNEHLGWAPDVYEHPKVRFYGADIRAVLPRLGQFDVIILDLPDPDEDTGYLYSHQFWDDIYTHLAVDGYMVTHCGPVRPYGNIGEGYQRVNHRMPTGRFYHTLIPSFQGEWGFLMWKKGAFRDDVRPLLPPAEVKVADTEQIRRWMTCDKVWQDAIKVADS
jgi:spermidine synthase